MAADRGPQQDNRLAELRAERGWSQGDRAARLDVSGQTVNAIETGRYDPSLPLAFTIAKLFAQPIEKIFIPNSLAAGRPRKAWIRPPLG